MRKFSKSILTAGLLSPLSAYALGIGDITTNSSLNQVLRAEIPLVGSQSEDPENIRVSLASPAAFEKAGMDRPFFLSTLKFNPILNADGSITVKVTSEDRIKEPFVNFLLEVEWPKGTTMREFTILLDPPVTMSSQTQPVQTTAVVPPPTAPNKESSPVAASASYQQANTRAAQAIPNSYGPVKKKDNLWRIAGDLIAGNDISREQMMLALYDENPQAFYKQNVNALMRGAVLKVPEREAILSRSVKKARREFNEQNRIWTSSSKSTSPSTKTAAPSQPQTSSSPSQPSPETAQAETQGQLKLLTPKEAQTQAENIPVEGGSVDTPVGSTEPSVQANMAMEMAASLEQENKEFQNRLASLESQVEKLQNQIALKDAELAKLEASKPAPKPKPAPTPAAESETSNLPWYVGGGLIVLLLAWLLGRRRSSDQTLPEPERAAIPDSPSRETEPAIESDSQSASSAESTEKPAESTLLSEFTASEFDDLGDQGQAADPLTETDVYIAYGRYQQAEDLMLNALEEEPDNHAYQLKLMDIYFASGKSKEFESYARDLQPLQREDPELWEQISTMGQELCPESPLFGDETSSTTPLPEEDITPDDAASINLDADEDLEAPLVIETDEADDSKLAEFEDSIETIETTTDTDDAETLSTDQPENKDDFEFDFELIQPTEDANEADDAGEADEATTKLALVEAYIDMEDLEAARETLNEVLEVGNEEQKAQAQKMLDEL